MRQGPRTARERRALIRNLLTRARAGDMDAAHVLLDALHDYRPDLAEDLALTLRGFAPLDAYEDGYLVAPRGKLLPAHLQIATLLHRLDNLQRTLFPRRRGPCMPNRAALAQLVASIHGPPDAAQRLTTLWRALKRACGVDTQRAIQDAMEVADEVLYGHGVEELRVQTRAGVRWGEYVNMGDTYNATLVWEAYSARFSVTTWGDVIESWERRWGRAEEGEEYA